MKKTKWLLLLCLLPLLAACGEQDTPEDISSEIVQQEDIVADEVEEVADISEQYEESEEIQGYYFTVGQVNFTVDMEADMVIAALGDYSNYYESASCAFEGELDKTYYYNSFEIYTYAIDGVDYIKSIDLKDDLVETPEGICLYMTYDDMVAAYGTEYEESTNQYVYTKDDTKLIFICQDQEIQAISYASMVLEQ